MDQTRKLNGSGARLNQDRLIERIEKRIPFWVFAICLFGVSTQCTGDTQNVFGSWSSIMLTGDLAELNPDWKRLRWLFMEQIRTRDDSDAGTRFSENLLWAQLGYQIDDHLSVWLGYTHAWIDPLTAPSFEENRPYQDLLINLPVWSGKVLARTRLEQRIHRSTGRTGVRLREWIQASYPMKFVSNKLSVYMGDEVLFYLNDSSFGRSGFAENRVLAGLNFNLDNHWKIDLGYLGQYIVNPNGRDLFTHNLMANLLYQF